MSFESELERTTRDIAALCRRSFGPCGEETLVFCPPEAPIVTGEGHAVLAAWKRGLNADDPLAKLLLNAANGVHQQLGDGSSEFILLVDAAVRNAGEKLRREHGVDRSRLSRAFGELKWELQRQMQTLQSHLNGLQVLVPIELDDRTMQPSKQFREASDNILKSALHGVLGDQSVEFVVDLALTWVFSTFKRSNAAERVDKVLFKRVQQYLKCAPDAIIFMAAPSVYASYVVPRDEFILKKSVVASQPLGILDRCQGSVRFVCFTCTLSLSAGSNHVELATTTDDELFTTQDAAHLFISKYIHNLRHSLQIQLVVSTEALAESVIAACTRQDIACVQLAEPDDVDALCISAAIFPLASVFDDVRMIEHVGVCANGVSRVRFQQQALVPQLLVHAPTKGVYKQYYASIVKCLRVLRSWWEPMPSELDCLLHDQQPAIARSCRGGGATEVAIARWLLDESEKNPSGTQTQDPVMLCLARKTFANAIIEVVSALRNNLCQTGIHDEGPTSNKNVASQRQVLLDAFSYLKINDQQAEKCHGYILDYSRVLETLAGPIQIPELVVDDPAKYGLLHPWRRIDTLLFLTLQTLEQLFRIDGLHICHT
ncbi:hypothetical protein PHPALM_28857 [Phytophthora palmivora]|uniref:Uncharacterized protein n=1 Tax=Phytophthora palmivora TaxID=4796 RepID=A0A2P4X905_9STRA|nr:hypothetical protein PHPALM_28857 [Phytophthora palmivora]